MFMGDARNTVSVPTGWVDLLGTLCPLGQLLHHADELLGPIACRTDVDAEEVLLRGRGHGEGVPLQWGDFWAVEEDILTHIHLESVLHQLQLQHLGWPDNNLGQGWRDEGREREAKERGRDGRRNVCKERRRERLSYKSVTA